MTIEQKLIDQGAQCVGGQLILKHKVLGDFKNGIFNPTDEGLAMAQIDDAVVKSETPKRKKTVKVDVVEAADGTPFATDMDLEVLVSE